MQLYRETQVKKFQAKMGLEHMTYSVPMGAVYSNGNISSQKLKNVIKNEISVQICKTSCNIIRKVISSKLHQLKQQVLQ